ncbi:hypothetical protein ABZ352_18735 [Streptomyces griseofuscus]|uniref:hypothetical protein n=1 Tax=Streptomyces griseofuscus TaxID=146922 RepID=UPI003402E011
MPSTTTAPVPPSAEIVLSALSAADGAAGFFDQEDRAIYAHPTSVPRANALDALHVMIDYETFDPEQPYADRALFTATAWIPDGAPDYHQVGTVYSTDVRRPFAEEAARCAQAVADWFAQPGRTAGSVLLAALEEYGITPGDGLSVAYGAHSDTYDIPVLLGEAYGRLSVADRDGSLRHLPGAHTGWSVFLHDEHGEPLGDPVYLAGTDCTVDCAEDSAAAAALIADWLTWPASRHCDCYSQERYGRWHDRECNRYAGPRATASAA